MKKVELPNWKFKKLRARFGFTAHDFTAHIFAGLWSSIFIVHRSGFLEFFEYLLQLTLLGWVLEVGLSGEEEESILGDCGWVFDHIIMLIYFEAYFQRRTSVHTASELFGRFFSCFFVLFNFIWNLKRITNKFCSTGVQGNYVKAGLLCKKKITLWPRTKNISLIYKKINHFNSSLLFQSFTTATNRFRKK